MRVPGIGDRSAKRIIRQRRYAAVKFDDLKKIGVVVKRAKYFILCCGRYYGDRKFEPEVIRNSMLQMENGLQMSMFDGSGAIAIGGLSRPAIGAVSQVALGETVKEAGI